MKANSEKTKQSKKATRRVLAGVLCGASVLSLVLSLVMPPISQAIANDAQTDFTEETVMGGGSSTESTDVDNTNNGDTKKQNSDETEGDEAGDDALRAASLSDDTEAEDVAEPADGDANDESAIALSADGEYFELSQSNINGVLGSDEKAGTYRLTEDITYDGMVTLGPGETVIDLYGHKIFHSGVKNNNPNLPMFNVPSGSTLTILDSKQAEDKKWEQPAERGKLASVSYSADGEKPLNLTYYVTESSVDTKDITRTNETTYKHEVAISGAIVGTKADSTMRLINVYAGGTFNLQSGVLTTTENAKVGSLIYAEEDSTVNMSGGYVCGATSMDHGAGIELGVNQDKGATLNLTGGVIAGNYAPDGGGVYANGSTINMTVDTTGGTTGGTISGNGTFEDRPGYGAGICAFGSSTVKISGGYITNNNCQFNYMTQNKLGEHKGFGCHGGGGIAAYNGGSLQISGGYITSNYSAEAGGGVYAGFFHQPLDSFTFSGGTIANNVAQNSEGGGVRIAAPTVGTFDVESGQKAYITNNETKTTNDWGGGGIFVQGGGNWNEGNSSTPVASAKLNIYSTLIKENHAEGFGGGFAACPSGKTAITDTKGIAIFGNDDNNGHNRSGGTGGKGQDQNKDSEHPFGEINDTFMTGGHKDLFLIRESGNGDYIAAVTGQMLGSGAANWKGTIDNATTSIGKYEGVQAKYMIGLEANPSPDDQGLAVSKATLFITGNTSNVHGGGIMTNGDVIAGSTTQVNVYPKMKLNGTKALEGRALTADDAGKFRFQLLEPGKSGDVPSFNNNDGKLQLNGCSIVGDDDGATNDAEGNFVFDLGRVHSAGTNVYYLVEDPGDHVDGVDGVYYDKTIYKIELTTGTETRQVLDINYINYLVTNVRVTNLKNNEVKTFTPPNGSDVSIKITDGKTGKTFTNAYKPKGSWIPRVTKKVDGGEMKKFKFKLYAENTGNTEKSFKPIYKYTTAGSKDLQIVDFGSVQIGPLGVNELDSNRQAKFTYYICECDADENDGTKHEGYKNDTKTFKVVVTATDKGDGTLECTPTYYEIEANNTESKTDNPTFTNTYSTSLPLSGMSGVTLTYLAGAAVLCAAAAWMHIRRKANAKGGERRE